MTKLVNLTPHRIVFVDPMTLERTIVNQDRTHKPIRVIQPHVTLEPLDINGVQIPVKLLLTGEPLSEEAVPPPCPGTLYVVSRLVADTYKGIRDDFVFGHDYKRERTGEILGCYALAKFGKAS